MIGAQAQGYNSSPPASRASARSAPPARPTPGCGAIARLLSWKLAVHGVPPHGDGPVRVRRRRDQPLSRRVAPTFERISGHRDGDATACPGDGLYAQLPQLRSMVAPGPPRAATRPRRRPSGATSPTARKAGLSVKLRRRRRAVAGAEGRRAGPRPARLAHHALASHRCLRDRPDADAPHRQPQRAGALRRRPGPAPLQLDAVLKLGVRPVVSARSASGGGPRRCS